MPSLLLLLLLRVTTWIESSEVSDLVKSGQPVSFLARWLFTSAPTPAAVFCVDYFEETKRVLFAKFAQVLGLGQETRS